MANQNSGMSDALRLSFRKGEQIFKEGDYGASVYRVISGEVELFTDAGGIEMITDTLGPGSLVGEMVFAMPQAPRLESARADQDTELQVWHVEGLSRELKKLSPFLRYVFEQPLARVKRTGLILKQLEQKNGAGPQPEAEAAVEAAPKEKEAEKLETTTPWKSQKREFYRKDVNTTCAYNPDGSKDHTMVAQIKDISRGGVGMEFSNVNMKEWSHDAGEVFEFDLTLPNGKKITFKAKIAHVKPAAEAGRLFAGMTITDIGYESKKQLGFFLLP